MNIVITGSSSGLGKSLYKRFKNLGHKVIGVSRTASETTDSQCNLLKISEINQTFNRLFDEINTVDYLFLNAGDLGRIDKANNIGQEELIASLQINVLANKEILDCVINRKITVKNVIAISSGASNKAYDGWLGYCLSKAALNQLIKCYAIENKEIYFLSLAPGIMQTKMQDVIVQSDPLRFSSIEKFKKLYGKNETPDDVSDKIIKNLDLLSNLESGQFFDLRDCA